MRSIPRWITLKIITISASGFQLQGLYIQTQIDTYIQSNGNTEKESLYSHVRNKWYRNIFAHINIYIYLKLEREMVTMWEMDFACNIIG